MAVLFLPAIYQGTRIGTYNRPIARAAIKNLERKLDANAQRDVLDLAQNLNHEAMEREQYAPKLRASSSHTNWLTRCRRKCRK